MRRFLLLPALLAAAAALAAEKIDISRPWGNKDGCINAKQQEVYSETMLLLRADAFVLATGVCEIRKTAANKDGSLTLQTECSSEGEGPVPDTLTVRRSKRDGKKITVFDGDGSPFPQDLSRCK